MPGRYGCAIAASAAAPGPTLRCAVRHPDHNSIGAASAIDLACMAPDYRPNSLPRIRESDGVVPSDAAAANASANSNVVW